jgi:hypothetical protein
MKKIWFGVCLLAVLMVVPSMVMASIVNVSRTTGFYDPYYGGGEFTVTGDSFSIQTFCLERGEYLTVLPGKYDATVNLYSSAVAGGGVWHGAETLPDGSIGDPISVGTAFLFRAFSDGTLSGYNYAQGAGRAASARILQYAIWGLEDEETVALGSNAFYDMAVAKFGSVSAAKANNPLGTDPTVLNLKNLDGSSAQDMLYTEKQHQSVPIPPTVYLLGAGLLGLVGMRRKFKK